jgi:hypothetical protein
MPHANLWVVLVATSTTILLGACKPSGLASERGERKDPRACTTADFVDSVLEEVYREEITSFDAEVVPHVEYFVSAIGGGDPSDALVSRLQRKGATVKKVSASQRDQNKVVRDRETGARGLILRVTDYRWLKDGTLYVEVSVVAGPGGVPNQDSACILTPIEGGWTLRPLWSGESASAWEEEESVHK